MKLWLKALSPESCLGLYVARRWCRKSKPSGKITTTRLPLCSRFLYAHPMSGDQASQWTTAKQQLTFDVKGFKGVNCVKQSIKLILTLNRKIIKNFNLYKFYHH